MKTTVDVTATLLDRAIVPVVSGGVFLSRSSSPLKVIMRMSSDESCVAAIGGKIMFFPIESIRQGMKREVLEETTWDVNNFTFIAALPRLRIVELDVEETLQLGIRGEAVREGTTPVLVCGELLFGAHSEQQLPEVPVEGRKLLRYDLAKKSGLPVKNRDSRAVQIYRRFATGRALGLTATERDFTERLLRACA